MRPELDEIFGWSACASGADEEGVRDERGRCDTQREAAPRSRHRGGGAWAWAEEGHVRRVNLRSNRAIARGRNLMCDILNTTRYRMSRQTQLPLRTRWNAAAG